MADGRVLSGSQALDARLVDQLGSLRVAIELAWSEAGLTGEPRVHYPKERETEPARSSPRWAGPKFHSSTSGHRAGAVLSSNRGIGPNGRRIVGPLAHDLPSGETPRVAAFFAANLSYRTNGKRWFSTEQSTASSSQTAIRTIAVICWWSPFRHECDPLKLDPEVYQEMGALEMSCMRILTEELRPDGFNLGMNVGSAGGGGDRGSLASARGAALCCRHELHAGGGYCAGDARAFGRHLRPTSAAFRCAESRSSRRGCLMRMLITVVLRCLVLLLGLLLAVVLYQSRALMKPRGARREFRPVVLRGAVRTRSHPVLGLGPGARDLRHARDAGRHARGVFRAHELRASGGRKAPKPREGREGPQETPGRLGGRARHL